MNFSELKNAIIADATSINVRTALVENGAFKTEFVSDLPSMESFADSLSKICSDFSGIDAYVICTGPGSVLGTRVASAAVSTLAKMHKAPVFEFDAMKIAAYAVFCRGGNSDFSILAPSRKGFANLLNFFFLFVECEREIEDENLASFCKPRKFLLKQKNTVSKNLSEIEEIEISLSETYEILKRYPNLATICGFPPDAKSLTKREYVKWKAQAPI